MVAGRRGCRAATRASAIAASATTRATVLELLLRPVDVARAGRLSLPTGAGLERRSRAGGHEAVPRWTCRSSLDAYRSSGLPATTMGRSLDEDRDFFLAALAGGAALAHPDAQRAVRGSRMSFERIGGEKIWEGHIGTVRVEKFRHDDGEVVAARGGRAPRRGR